MGPAGLIDSHYTSGPSAKSSVPVAGALQGNTLTLFLPQSEGEQPKSRGAWTGVDRLLIRAPDMGQAGASFPRV